MNPEQRLLLDEIDKRFEKHFDRLERRLEETSDSSSTRLAALESAARVFDEWRPGVDGVIDDLRGEVNKLASLKLEVGKISKYMERTMVVGASDHPGIFASAPIIKSASAPASPSASLKDVKPAVMPLKSPAVGAFHRDPGHASPADPRAPAGVSANRPDGHRVASGNRDGDFGVVTTLIPPLGKGGRRAGGCWRSIVA